MKYRVILGTAFVLLIAGSCAVPSSQPTGETVNVGTYTSTGRPSHPIPPKVLVHSYGAGTYSVPDEIKPGTYHSSGGRFCYWERERDGRGELGSIIANGAAAGPQIVTIRKTDFAFKTTGCGKWSVKR